MKTPMPCWMTATGSLTSQDSSMDVVMQYKTIISTIRREEPMSLWGKSKIVGLRQKWSCERRSNGLECQNWTSEKQIILLVVFCVSFWSYLNRKNGGMVQSSFQNRITHNFQSVTGIWATSIPIYVCRCFGKKKTGKLAQDHCSPVTIL